MGLPLFTLLHTMISLVGIAAGFGVAAGLVTAKQFPGWIVVFLVTTFATSATGFLFPITTLTPD